MAGATITLKNVPPELHRSLKESAKRHKRSLNQEAIHFLETALLRDQGDATGVRQAPSLRSVGKILVSPEALISRADDMLDRDE
jgi:plasmid stability protein